MSPNADIVNGGCIRAGNYVVAMSGGVDSSVSAAMLKTQGANVVGVTLIMRHEDETAAHDAEQLCKKLSIPHIKIDASAEFERYVASAFVRDYSDGLTPNPCVCCNRNVKLPLVFREGRRLFPNGDFTVVSGHYANIGEAENGAHTLMRGADRRKDQSYVLWGIDEEYLSRLYFPLGGVSGKAEVRSVAADIVPDAASKKDSQDICFIPDGDYGAYLSGRGIIVPEGDYIDRDGNRIGRHRGHINYTVGQRKGLGVAFGHPVFVQSKCAENNTVTLGESEELFKREASAREVKIFSYASEIIAASLETGAVISAKIRYAGEPSDTVVTAFDSAAATLTLRFNLPVRAVTPGQSLVLYDKETVLGGGIII